MDTNFSDPRTVWARRGQLQIVDVREPMEFTAGAIAGAVNIALGELMAGGGGLEPNFPVVLVCKNGQRSELAALMLQARGFNAFNLAGGMEAWAAEGLPFADASGQAGRVA